MSELRDAVRHAFYETRSVEETARRLGIPISLAHQRIVCMTGNQDINEDTFFEQKQKSWYVSVARFGSDTTVVATGLNETIVELRKCRIDTTATIVKALSDDLRPASITVNTAGVGAGLADRLLALGLPVREVV